MHIEVYEHEDFVYSHDTFIHFFYPREKLVESSNFMGLINRFALENNLRLVGEIIEVHDLKQLFFNDFDYIECYVAVEDYKD